MLQIIILVALVLGILFAALWVDRWQRKQSYHLTSNPVLIGGDLQKLGLAHRWLEMGTRSSTIPSDRATRRNNEVESLDANRSIQQAEPELYPSNEWSRADAPPEAVIVEDEGSGFPLIEPRQAPPEIKACLDEIQDTLGIPWLPMNWRAYALYPEVLQLFWQRLKPVTQTEAFLEHAVAIMAYVYENANDWYQPSFQIHIEEADQHHIQRELNAFSFGNPQLLIQQVVLSRVLAGETVGQEGNPDSRRGPNLYRHHKIQLIDEQAVGAFSEEMQRVYRDIKQTLGVPLISSEYQALARWPTFFLAAWEDIKRWRDRPEYGMLRQDIEHLAADAVNRLQPTIWIGKREVRDCLDNPEDFTHIQQTVQMFEDMLPELIMHDALFHLSLESLTG